MRKTALMTEMNEIQFLDSFVSAFFMSKKPMAFRKINFTKGGNTNE